MLLKVLLSYPLHKLLNSVLCLFLLLELLVLSIFFPTFWMSLFPVPSHSYKSPGCVQPLERTKLSSNWCLAANFSSETSALHPHWSPWEAREPVWAQSLTFSMVTASYTTSDHATLTVFYLLFKVLKSLWTNYTIFIFFFWTIKNKKQQQTK